MREMGIVSSSALEGERQFETALRPTKLADFTGQPKLKENLSIAIEAAKQRGEAMDHVLLYGPPGLGKTTLATIIAAELGVGFEQTSGPILQKKLDLTGVLTNIRPRQVFFIDEVHRLLPDVEEILYAALEDFRMDILIGTGPGARTHSIAIPHFTAIGATTRQGLVSAPLRGRFGLVLRLNHYGVEELTAIVLRSAKLLGVTVDRDGATVALDLLEVDRFGLDEIDQKIMLTLLEKYGGGPVGVNTIAASIDEEADTIEEVYEPYLMQLGFIDRTPRGRIGTDRAFDYFKIPRRMRGGVQSPLF